MSVIEINVQRIKLDRHSKRQPSCHKAWFFGYRNFWSLNTLDGGHTTGGSVHFQNGTYSSAKTKSPQTTMTRLYAENFFRRSAKS
jgi:hypothetical protein